MIPRSNDTRASYVARCEASHLHIAQLHYDLGGQRSMWLQLFYSTMAEDIYGEHWDKLKKEGKI
jgi:hypothetical protein